MALSLAFGRDEAYASKDLLNKKIQEFVQGFESHFHSINCTTLTGCDLSAPDGPANFERMKLHPTCSGFVEEAARILMPLLK